MRALLARIQQDHGSDCVATVQACQAASSAAESTKRLADEAAASRNANVVLMLRAQLKSLGERAVIANKAALEAEKARDELHNQIEHIEKQLHPKRARTHDDAGDAHEMLAEVENWDLRDHRQQATRVQNRRNVQVQVLWTESHGGGRLYAHQADLLDRRRIYCHHHQGFGIVT